jgi:hypothetical protein
VVLLVTALWCGPAWAVSKSRGTSRASGGCANVQASSTDQYCEMLPTAGGGHTPSGSDTMLGASLLPRIARAALRLPQGAALGALPARDPRSRRQPLIGVAGARPANVDVSGWSLALPIVAILGLAALGALLLGALRLRRTWSAHT